MLLPVGDTSQSRVLRIVTDNLARAVHQLETADECSPALEVRGSQHPL